MTERQEEYTVEQAVSDYARDLEQVGRIPALVRKCEFLDRQLRRALMDGSVTESGRKVAVGRVVELEAELRATEEERDALKAQNANLSARVAALEAQVETLETQARGLSAVILESDSRYDLLKQRVQMYREACYGTNAVLRYRRRGVLFATPGLEDGCEK